MPILVVMACIGTLSMLIIALHAATLNHYAIARPFFYGGVVLTGCAVLVGIAAQTWQIQKPVRAMLLTIVGAYFLLPWLLALPLIEASPGMSLLDGYLEMVSSLTTTGLPILSDARGTAPSVHLWRALIGWYGGFLIWVAAIAIFAPLRLGGFEVLASRVRQGKTTTQNAFGKNNPRERLTRHTMALMPVYTGLTLLLWILLLLTGEDPFVALCHAMSTLSTSGITPLHSFSEAGSSRWAELAIFLFFIFALLRRSFAKDMSSAINLPMWREPELRAAAFIVALLTTLLILRHWVDPAASQDGVHPLLLDDVIWGSLFTSLSFLTTTGFVSADWVQTQSWSGLQTPALVLMGLVLIGGGVATTAGGVKLLRVYILYRHSAREMSRLVHPSLVSHLGSRGRAILPENALIAWVYFMTFGLSICAIMLALTATGIGFEAASVLAVATLSTTGPLIPAIEPGFTASSLTDGAKFILCLSMLLGRLGTLTLVALLNPGFWRF